MPVHVGGKVFSYHSSIGGYNIPFVVILLVVGATFFTIYFKFPSFTKFWLAINTVRGKYDDIEGGHHVQVIRRLALMEIS